MDSHGSREAMDQGTTARDGSASMLQAGRIVEIGGFLCEKEGCEPTIGSRRRACGPVDLFLFETDPIPNP